MCVCVCVCVCMYVCIFSGVWIRYFRTLPIMLLLVTTLITLVSFLIIKALHTNSLSLSHTYYLSHTHTYTHTHKTISHTYTYTLPHHHQGWATQVFLWCPACKELELVGTRSTDERNAASVAHDSSIYHTPPPC